MYLQRLQFILLLLLFNRNISTANRDTSAVGQFKHQVGIGLAGPFFMLANAIEGRPVWHNPPLQLSYAYQFHEQFFLRTDLLGSIGFDLNDRDGIMNDYSLLTYKPVYHQLYENHLYVLRGKQQRIGINLGLEWVPFKGFKYLSLVNGFTLSKHHSDYYTRIQLSYSQINSSGVSSIAGTEFFYRITELKYAQIGGYSQIRFSYPLHPRISVSVEGYLYWVWNQYDRVYYNNYKEKLFWQDQYTIFEALGKVSAGVSFYF